MITCRWGRNTVLLLNTRPDELNLYCTHTEKKRRGEEFIIVKRNKKKKYPRIWWCISKSVSRSFARVIMWKCLSYTRKIKKVFFLSFIFFFVNSSARNNKPFFFWSFWNLSQHAPFSLFRSSSSCIIVFKSRPKSLNFLSRWITLRLDAFSHPQAAFSSSSSSHFLLHMVLQYIYFLCPSSFILYTTHCTV